MESEAQSSGVAMNIDHNVLDEMNQVGQNDDIIIPDLNEEPEENVSSSSKGDHVPVNQTNSNVDDDNNRVAAIALAVGMLFQSGEEFAQCCHKYAYEKGFEFYVRTDTLMKGYKVVDVNLRGVGKKEPKYHMMSRIRMDWGWFVITQCVLDNHPLLSDCTRRMVNYRGIEDDSYERMALNDAAGISLGKSYNSFVIEKGGPSKLSFTKQDMINVVHVQRRLILFQGDALAVEQHFTKMTEEDPNFYSDIQQDQEGKLLNGFWYDARGRAMYRDFGDIVSFDTTFLCRYKMPFAPFVGCNHYGSTIHFGAALITHEDFESFEWVFRHFLECMCQPPKGILTEQCKAIGKAGEIVFLDVSHRLCLFHIKQNAARNLGKLPRWKEIEANLNHVVHDNFCIEQFEDAWKVMVTKNKLQKNTWLSDAYANRHRWAPGYWRRLFWAGMSSTQHSESTNRGVKVYVCLNTGLMQFMNQFNAYCGGLVEREKDLNYKTKRNPFFYDNIVLAEVVFSKAYTNDKFLEVRDEVIGLMHTNIVKTGNIGSMILYDADEKIPKPVWKATRRTFKVSVDKEKGEFSCSCKLFEFRGILCRHIIQVIHTKDIECITEKYILNRWRKERP
ncbi:protein FAR1-RELATED SEQUENCE 5-like [Chenopodium quinoa]|uniref:protein FAR1-RELATED SEQUENCE 5-like n=1 Tax=Chenopodium quinoa TaxID=63459 RepID=UPI000B7985DC|nr:protein FAR1-RELATED SEQUENCE 5-like [Chenopodium quinoa]